MNASNDDQRPTEGGTSENNRRARFYTPTPAGKRHLQAETANWERVSGVMSRMLQLQKVQS